MKKMNVLFASSECAPFIKTGGLGDVAASLPKYFPREEADVRVILPLYDCIPEKYRKDLKKVADFDVNVFLGSGKASLYETVRDETVFYLIGAEGAFTGDTPYMDTYNDIGKFAFFCKAVLSVLPVIRFKPDIIHANDWQTALLPVYIKLMAGQWDFYSKTKTVMTIHNLQFQGMADKEHVKIEAGINGECLGDDYLGFYDQASLLKGGIAYADMVTTVSRTYAEEIRTPFYGEGLDGLLMYRSADLKGIVNGIDNNVFNPETDASIYKNYSIETFRKAKPQNKKHLQKELNLKEDAGVMMIALISRLTEQKGIDLNAYIMDELCRDAVQLVVLGTGDEKYESMFRHYAWKYSDSVSANICYSEELSRQIYASADAFLMPSRFEPCGLSQLMAMRYGTVPIVRETGGLKDTVQPYNEYEHTGTGFSFANYNAHEMLGTIRYAERIYYDNKRDWNKIAKRAMQMDYSWNASAQKYLSMYRELQSR